MNRNPLIVMLAVMTIASLLVIGCSEDVFIGDREKNDAPEVWLSSGPVEGDTTGYQVHFYWGGWDPDGEIQYFEYVIAPGDPTGFMTEDTTGLDKWNRTTAHDSLFRVTANDSGRTVTINNSMYTRYDKTHTFFIRAVDNLGHRSEATFRSFTAWTLAPYVEITHPTIQNLALITEFQWTGRDPIDDPSNSQDPDSVRYLIMISEDSTGKRYDFIEKVPNETDPDPITLNRHPEYFEERWSPWIYYRAEGDSGRRTMIGDDEVIEPRYYLFAVQAKDEAGAVTSIFQRDLNAKIYIASEQQGPLLTVNELFIGSNVFLGTGGNNVKKQLPPGVEFNFSWNATAERYGGLITGYRYGWDITDVNDDSQWQTAWDPSLRTAPPRTLYAGIHFFYIEARDNGNVITRAVFEIEIIRFSMERNLLLVDDWFSIDTPTIFDYSFPPEDQHDPFWTNMLIDSVNVDGFNPEEDIYDCPSNNNKLPPITLIAHYKNIIWYYSNDPSNCWRKLVEFTPESQANVGTTQEVNYLPLFLAKGGHVLTLGRADRSGGISFTFPANPEYPASIKYEMAANEDDTSSVYSMGYKDYCITMIDKCIGNFKQEPEIQRSTARDGLRYAYRADDDDTTLLYPGLPELLELRPEVTDNFARNGFYFVEIYNPEYWMDLQGAQTQPCFHPMYRMRTQSSISQVDRTTIAIWLTKYDHIEPEVDDGIAVAAKSFHFGIPFWFFNHDQIADLMDVVVTEWQIKAAP